MFKYNEGGEIVEIIIRDSSGAKMDTFKFKLNDVKLANQILSTLKKKYDLGEGKKDRDIDWLKRDGSW